MEMCRESDFAIHVLCGHDVFRSFVFHFTCPKKKKQGINLLQTSNANIDRQISMRNGLLQPRLTTVQAACGAKRAGSRKCIQRSQFRSSSSPQLQCRVYSQTALAPGRHRFINRAWLRKEGLRKQLWSHANQILKGSNKGGAKTALIQVFGITQIYEFMDKLEENRK